MLTGSLQGVGRQSVAVGGDSTGVSMTSTQCVPGEGRRPQHKDLAAVRWRCRMRAAGNRQRGAVLRPEVLARKPLFHMTGSSNRLSDKYHKPNDRLPSPGFPLCSTACASQRSKINKISKLQLLTGPQLTDI